MSKQAQTAAAEKPQEKPITEEVHIYPAGRGHVFITMKKRIPPKPRKYKRKQPRFAHARLQTNPEDITITEYLGTENRKHIYLFPAKKQLTHQERRDLALSLLATLPRYTVPRYLGRGNNNKTSVKYPVFLNQDDRATLKRKWKRYRKWRKRNM